jgi:magnesium-transporting ATPase (P-type)
MQIPPRAPEAPLLNFRQFSRVLVMGLVMCTSVLVIYNTNLHRGHQYAQTLAFLSLIVVQWANALNANFEYKSWVHNFVKPNKKLLAAIGGSVILQLFVFLGPLGNILGVVPVEPRDAAMTMIFPVIAVFLAVDLHKLIFHHVAKRRRAA